MTPYELVDDLFSVRNDAGLAAAELALAVEKHVLESGSIDTVGTVGKSCFSLQQNATSPIVSGTYILFGY